MTDQNLNTSEPAMIDRRKMLAGAGLIAAASTVGSTARASNEHTMDHSAHGMKKYQAVTDASMHCVKMGQACIEHCLVLFKNGDTSVADCARSAQEMLSMCQTMAQFAAFESDHLGKVARVCIDVCTACEKECRKHADKHMDCKNCAESCLACIEQCKKVAA